MGIYFGAELRSQMLSTSRCNLISDLSAAEREEGQKTKNNKKTFHSNMHTSSTPAVLFFENSCVSSHHQNRHDGDNHS
jgi:hypothetical protein